MEIWGGIECSINRLGEKYFSQLDYRPIKMKDLELLVGLGIKKLRYPLLWERHKKIDGTLNWYDAAAQLAYLRNHGIEIIAGLVHHGSGPAYVKIQEESFVKGLATYAAEVAQQFPWIKYYTPVNEPLTTARFCGLYGLWHPHHTTEPSFLRILVNECKATILAMSAIKTISPQAELVHTEDLGKTYSTPNLQYQATYENQRRWLGIDLLCGKVDQRHSLYRHLLANNISEKELVFFTANAAHPTILGFNHYLTSDRYLDDQLANYPVHLHGGNGIDCYVDVEAVRVAAIMPPNIQISLMEAWQRYGLPLAITEAHLHCGREDQLRWLNYIWKAATELAAKGVDIKGVTAWSLFGSNGWEKLLTAPPGAYESGAFDGSSGITRPTAIATLIRHYADGQGKPHPLIMGKGWWETEKRVIFPKIEQLPSISCKQVQPVMIIGASGTLGNAFVKECNARNINFFAPSSKEVSVLQIKQLEAAIERYRPWAIINAAGYVDVDGAERNGERCMAINTHGPALLAACCLKYSIKLVTFSSDLVFDGLKQTCYTENDPTQPLNNYGRSKAMAERQVLHLDPTALVIRTSAFFGPWDRYNFLYTTMETLVNKQILTVANDLFISPTYVPDLTKHTIDLLIDDQCGIWHLANEGTLSWFELAAEVAERTNLDTRLLVPCRQQEMNLPALRPARSGLKSVKGNTMPSLCSGLDRFFSSPEIQQYRFQLLNAIAIKEGQ